MNKIKTLLLAVAMITFVSSCVNDMSPEVEYLDVTSNNIAGTWQLVQWQGAPLTDGTYLYVEFVRKGNKFTIWQNFDSIGQLPHVVTGEYNIDTDQERGAILLGKYDYSEGLWLHDYEVDDLTASSMKWTATDDPTFVQIFERVDKIPAELK